MKYKHVIWDWNGTLLDDRWLCVEGINQGLLKRGLPIISEKTYRKVFTFPVENYYKKLGFNFEKEPFEIAGDEFVAYYGKCFSKATLHKDVRYVLNKFYSLNITQSVLSAGKHDFLLQWVTNHNLKKYFLKIIGINNQYAKGKTEQGLSLIKDLPYDEEDVILIGDTIHDSEVAERMKINCFLIDHGHVSNERLKSTGRKVFSNLKDIIFHII